MTDRIGISTVEVLNIENTVDHPFRDCWSGSMKFQGDEITFSTKFNELDEGGHYRVVWERTEPAPGDQLVVIHDVLERYPDYAKERAE